jgi:hypothetical protein
METLNFIFKTPKASKLEPKAVYLRKSVKILGENEFSR